jgi:hypothetical protein
MTSKQFEKFDPGVGPTKELSLRVSVGTLARVVFANPENGDPMLALERKATFLADEKRVEVKAQPFGGAIRINDAAPLTALTGGFHFDSERSSAEHDFRILIRPSAWNSLRDFCLERFWQHDDQVLESSPVRELEEEFGGALGFGPKPDQYELVFLWTLLEDEPTPTRNFYAEGQPTVRIYRVFEARIVDPALSQAIRLNSERYSNQDLRERALEDLRKGGKGWANAFLALPAESLRKFYSSLAPERRNSAVVFGEINLAESVPALLDGITVPRYRSV